MTPKNGHFWTDEFKEWVAVHYGKGLSASQISRKAFEEHGATLTRNAVIGIACRAGAIARAMQDKSDLHYPIKGGGRMSKITLCGPEWAMPDRPDVRRAA